MTSSLEKQVAERTAQLTEVNDQLQIELTERQRIEEQLAYNALHDPLTDLPNRALFMDRLGHVMKRARRRNDHTYAVIFLDLDRFKVVNDSLGHNIGDLMLQETARRLLKCVRGEDTVARLGGDEFVVLLEELENEMDHLKIAERIQEDLSTPPIWEIIRCLPRSALVLLWETASMRKPKRSFVMRISQCIKQNGQGGAVRCFQPRYAGKGEIIPGAGI